MDCLIFSDLTRPYFALLGVSMPYLALLGLTGPYWALLGLTNVHYDLLGCFCSQQSTKNGVDT